MSRLRSEAECCEYWVKNNELYARVELFLSCMFAIGAGGAIVLMMVVIASGGSFLPLVLTIPAIAKALIASDFYAEALESRERAEFWRRGVCP